MHPSTWCSRCRGHDFRREGRLHQEEERETIRHAPLRGGEGDRAEAPTEEPQGVVDVVQTRSTTVQHPERPKQDVQSRRLDLVARLAWVRDDEGTARHHAPLHRGKGDRTEAQDGAPRGVEGVEQIRATPLQHPDQPRQDVPQRRLDLHA